MSHTQEISIFSSSLLSLSLYSNNFSDFSSFHWLRCVRSPLLSVISSLYVFTQFYRFFAFFLLLYTTQKLLSAGESKKKNFVLSIHALERAKGGERARPMVNFRTRLFSHTICKTYSPHVRKVMIFTHSRTELPHCVGALSLNSFTLLFFSFSQKFPHFSSFPRITTIKFPHFFRFQACVYAPRLFRCYQSRNDKLDATSAENNFQYSSLSTHWRRRHDDGYAFRDRDVLYAYQNKYQANPLILPKEVDLWRFLINSAAVSRQTGTHDVVAAEWHVLSTMIVYIKYFCCARE